VKKLPLIFFLFPLISFSQSGSFSEPLSFYGEKISTENVLDYNSFIENSKVVSKSKIEGTILSSCPKKGCWMQVKIDSDTIQVTFKDYGFFVPKTGLENKKTILEGYPKQDTISIKMLKHFAEDAGKSQKEIDKITKPKYKISFIADGVIIKN
jgi:hypothetical protein